MAPDLFDPLRLPCGVILKNRIAKAAMSDSLGDGTGHPSAEQVRLYERWAGGGLSLAIVGEVQGSAEYAEKPGNLVLNKASDRDRFRHLARRGSADGAQLWLQLGHAGALAYPPTSDPKGPSALDLPKLRCGGLSLEEIGQALAQFKETALLAKEAGFGGVEIHAAHGFLLSQFLSPLFNKRTDRYGGDIGNRMRLLLEVIEVVRSAVGPHFPISVKLNSSDQLEGGLTEADALKTVAALERTSLDLIDISGGTYFPGAKAASDSGGQGPYFLRFARKTREITSKPLMLTGGFKTYDQAREAVASGSIDLVGLARAFVIEPDLPNHWREGRVTDPPFPRFNSPPEGGVTAWYTMRLTDIGADREGEAETSLAEAIKVYEARDRARTEIWLDHFGKPNNPALGPA